LGALLFTLDWQCLESILEPVLDALIGSGSVPIRRSLVLALDEPSLLDGTAPVESQFVHTLDPLHLVEIVESFGIQALRLFLGGFPS